MDFYGCFPTVFSDKSISVKVMHVDTDDEVLKGQVKKNILNCRSALF
jgi:hypothetical protein